MPDDSRTVDAPIPVDADLAAACQAGVPEPPSGGWSAACLALPHGTGGRSTRTISFVAIQRREALEDQRVLAGDDVVRPVGRSLLPLVSSDKRALAAALR